MLVFAEGGKPENPEKNPRSKDENQQQTQPTYDAGSIEPGTHWWEASALPAMPFLLSCEVLVTNRSVIKANRSASCRLTEVPFCKFVVCICRTPSQTALTAQGCPFFYSCVERGFTDSLRTHDTKNP